MSSPETEPEPLREKPLPQTSLRFFLMLIAVSGVVMFTFRTAFVGGQSWAKVVSLLIAITVGCFVAYAALFLMANLFAVSTMPIREALAGAAKPGAASPSSEEES